jgi:NADPH:quinone reductase-like Zn-dependent oxidoreductase
MPTDVRATQKRLLSVLNLIVEGRLKVPIEARFPLSKAADAYELSRAGHARGKILLIPGIL